MCATNSLRDTITLCHYKRVVTAAAYMGQFPTTVLEITILVVYKKYLPLPEIFFTIFRSTYSTSNFPQATILNKM